MVPDFSGLRQQSDAITNCRSSEHKHRQTSKELQSFLQSASDKTSPSSSTSTNSDCLSSKSTAQSTDYQSVSRQTTSNQTDADNSSVTSLLTTCDYTTSFFQLWLEQPSWSPIVRTKNGWVTVKGNGTKKVPLTLGSLQSYYKRNLIIGKRFGRLTNYLMLDIDVHSPYHPNQNGLDSVLAAMEAIGLVRYLIVRSSASGGLHIYFPLAEAVNAWALACAAYRALSAHNVVIAGGQCELFPNKKAFNAEHNGHRLPLQNGSFLLDDGFCPVGDHKAEFVLRWQSAAALQNDERLQKALIGSVVYAPVSTALSGAAGTVGTDAVDVVEVNVVDVPATVTTPQVLRSTTGRTQHVIPPIVWSRFGQSNDIMRELVNYGDRYVGLKNATDLAAWVKAVAPQLPGYQQFASPKSKQDIETGNWSWRWSKSHFESVWKRKVGGTDHNANVKADARWRLFAALERVCVDVNIGVTALWKQLSQIAKSCFDKGIAWKTFKKYREEVLAYIKHIEEVGPSTCSEEDKNFPSGKPLTTQETETEVELENATQQLSTHRCVIAIYSNVLAQFYTPQTESTKSDDGEVEVETEAVVTDEVVQNNPEAAKGGLQTRELAVGQTVRIMMPGGSLDGVVTRVVEQTVDVLGQRVYLLDYRREGRAITLPKECLQIIS